MIRTKLIFFDLAVCPTTRKSDCVKKIFSNYSKTMIILRLVCKQNIPKFEERNLNNKTDDNVDKTQNVEKRILIYVFCALFMGRLFTHLRKQLGSEVNLM